MYNWGYNPLTKWDEPPSRLRKKTTCHWDDPPVQSSLGASIGFEPRCGELVFWVPGLHRRAATGGVPAICDSCDEKQGFCQWELRRAGHFFRFFAMP